MPGCNSHFVFANWVYFLCDVRTKLRKDEFVCIEQIDVRTKSEIGETVCTNNYVLEGNDMKVYDYLRKMIALSLMMAICVVSLENDW